jgi:hypothetical protein
VFAQTVSVIEYWNVIVQLCYAVAYAFNRRGASETLWDRTMQAARSIAFATDRTRVLVLHATFLNQLDEMYHNSNFCNEEHDDSPMQGSAEPAGSDLALRQR